MKDIKSIVAKNMTELRQANNMTQMELAEKLNYSDKTISKWERAESTPDISVLAEIAELFGVTLDYFVTEEQSKREHSKREHRREREREVTDGAKYNRRIIAYISESVPWLVAILAFIITTLIINKMTFQILYFSYALPIAMIVKLVFNSVWFNPRHNYFIISLLVWSLLAAIHITFLQCGINVALIYLLGVAGQIVIVLWSFIKKPQNEQK